VLAVFVYVFAGWASWVAGLPGCPGILTRSACWLSVLAARLGSLAGWDR
jgi:hypothetical protein